jgi:hypothetical protein
MTFAVYDLNWDKATHGYTRLVNQYFLSYWNGGSLWAQDSAGSHAGSTR